MMQPEHSMNLPIHFPSDEKVITEETRRLRALLPAERVRTLGELFEIYHFLTETSPRREAIVRFANEDEARARQAVHEFAARHG